MLAAAGNLIVENGGDPEDAARQAADEIVRLNPVMNTSAGLAQGDVEFGRAVFNSTTGRYSFEFSSQPYDAVRVTVRRSEGAEGGPLMLGFANVFGRSSKGLADWQSGYPGAARPGGGNGNDIIGDSELVWHAKPAWYTTSWTNYINYVASSYSAMENTDPQLRYRYGLKTLVNYALEQRPRNNQTPVLWATPEQPLQAVKDAVNSMVGVIAALDSLDNLSLEIFAQSARHEVDLTDQLSAVPDRLFNMQAAHYDNTTNLAGGLAQAINVLTGPDARPSAAKVIVIMSDGKPNTNQEGGFVGFGGTAYDLVRERAHQAKDEFIRIYAVSVGEDVDRSLMQEIGAITGGQEFHASGTPEEYTEEIEAIFRSLGGVIVHLAGRRNAAG